MKLRMIDRILIALSGLLLLALAAWMALDALSVVPPLSEFLAALLYVGEPRSGWIIAGACAVPALLGIFDFCVLFRRGKGKRGFIAQRSENGEISISVKTIETLVIKCAQKHGEIAVQSVTVEEERNGLLIKLRAALPSGMNIPLAVGTLQKQIKQYITACSGVDVSEVRVKVDSTDRTVSNSVYAVSDDQAALPVEEPEPAPVPMEAVMPVEMPQESPEPVPEERELLTHQRLFSAQEEPALVPEPPVEETPDAPSEEEIRAEVEQSIADLAEEEAAQDIDWVEQGEPQWDAKADEIESQAEQWEAAAAQIEADEEADDRGEPDEEKSTEE